MPPPVDARRERENLLDKIIDGDPTPNFLLGGTPVRVLLDTTGGHAPTKNNLLGNILYRCYGENKELLYLGMTQNLFVRVAGARTWGPTSGHRYRPWWSEVSFITVKSYATREILAAEERRAILNESPRHNIVDQFVSRVSTSTRRGVRVLGEHC